MIIFVIALCLTMSGCSVENQLDKKIEGNENKNYENMDLDEVEIKEPVID